MTLPQSPVIAWSKSFKIFAVAPRSRIAARLQCIDDLVARAEDA